MGCHGLTKKRAKTRNRMRDLGEVFSTTVLSGAQYGEGCMIL
jgi:hypothetical protein